MSFSGFFKRLGPGIITGAADDDPSGIATYSQAGAQAGFGLLWTVVLTWPMMVAVQSVSGRIGRATGRGLAANMLDVFPRPVVLALVVLLFLANTINIGADLSAMGAAVRLVVAAASISTRCCSRSSRCSAPCSSPSPATLLLTRAGAPCDLARTTMTTMYVGSVH